jgi:hypothetical protein
MSHEESDFSSKEYNSSGYMLTSHIKVDAMVMGLSYYLQRHAFKHFGAGAVEGDSFLNVSVDRVVKLLVNHFYIHTLSYSKDNRLHTLEKSVLYDQPPHSNP